MRQFTTLQNTLEHLFQQYPNATVLTLGDSLKGDLSDLGYSGKARFIFTKDAMAIGYASPRILSQEYITMREEALANQLVDSCQADNCLRDDVSKLQSLKDGKNTEFVLLQYDCYLSSIWQLTIQAYLEQMSIANRVTRIVYYMDCNASEFCVQSVDKIPIAGSYEAFSRLVCNHSSCDLSVYAITAEEVDCYLDINSADGRIRKYIKEVSSTYRNPFDAYGRFLQDFPKWGLSDADFFKIAYETLSESSEYAKALRNWQRIVNR